MKIKLTLQEKLRDLREERNMTLAEVAERTGIPLSTLGHLEKDEDMRVGYQDVAALAKFYSVSADYLFGLTDNRLHRNIPIDDISLSDGAIDVLKNKKANNRLISELLAHSDFPYLISAMEVYIDGKISAQTGNMMLFSSLQSKRSVKMSMLKTMMRLFHFFVKPLLMRTSICVIGFPNDLMLL